MARLTSILSLVLALASPSPTAAAPPDSISGQPLLGSSFGIPFNATYDYVIIGGGTAGLVLANRLSASGAHSVAVLEAGSFYEISNSNQSQIPRWVWNGAGLGFGDVNPLVDWEIETEPEEGSGGARIHYPRGRTLGGSSSRNHMVYHRGTKGSYKKWADEVGDKGYEWDKFKAYFEKSTTFNKADGSKRLANSTPAEDPAGARSKDGPVSISYTNWVLPITSWVLKATEALGMKPIPGFIDGDLIGSSWNMRTTDPKTQVRDSAETAYLRPALKRRNLIVYHTTYATKILFNGTEAVGVRASTLGKAFALTARKEVILSAGAIHSPQLLMISGIGPKATLDKYGISVLKDAPGVGQGIEDHPAIGVTYKVRVKSSTFLDTPAKNEEAVREYLEEGTGPLSSTGGELVAWEKVPRRLVSNKTAAALDVVPKDWPDLEFLVTSSYPGLAPDKDDYAGVTVVLVNTFSRGTVTIASSSIFDQAIVHINFLTHPVDQELAIAGFKRAREIMTHKSMAAVVVGDEVLPGNGTFTDAQILKYVKAGSRTISHVSCTCKMGKKSDPLAVVDSEGRVFGIQKLRIVDASGIPFLPPGHPMSTIYALAEKLADRILGGK
ncbi:GMC oxidoreductase [Amniculicola lignicola CBS 123094]|uniref:GMC oxidoreductase n=1 Tax=Amniculicola lignicola CBS 123094 TaxID=1392246 RepID=A0A6A5WTD8_9PLEO|nr:GMC oxidoreductase [Amniculicola lignicola CBS 123094]